MSLHQRIIRLERNLNDKLKGLEVFNKALEIHLKQHQENDQNSKLQNIQDKWHQKVRSDSELRYPHKKIMEKLIGNFDYSTREFKERTFSQLVKDARLGKNKASSYLADLENKGLIQQRSDGYRKLIKING